jgi:N-methylhydantoinase B
MAAGDRVDVDPEADANQGVQELIDIVMPEGCFLNPSRPAPVSLRHLTMVRVTETIQGTLAQIFPDAIPATHNGSLNCYSLLGRGRSEEDRWLCFEVMAAGSGGRPGSDGIDAFSWNTRLKNAPAEFMETVYPVRVEQYSLRPGSSGPGRHRGGYGLIRAIRTLRPATLYFLDDRHRTQPWGLHGGGPAAANDAFVVRAGGEIVQLPSKFDDMKLDAGDMFVMRTGGGGGWGDPFEREPERVLRDVRDGYVSIAGAARDYGVVVAGDPEEDPEGLAIDQEATRALRSRR